MEAPKPAEKPKKKGYAPKGKVTGLGKALANSEPCREQLLHKKTVLRWPDPKLTGMCTGRALKLNKPVMLAVSGILCPQSEHKLGLVVKDVKAEVKKMREDLLMEPDPSGVHCEGHAIKGFQTLINKRLFASKKKRDAALEDLYAVYRKQWRPTQEEIDRAKARGIKLLCMEGPDEGERKADQVVQAEGDDEDEGYYYVEEGEEEEALEEDAYMDDSQDCISDQDLGRKLGIPDESLIPAPVDPPVPASASKPEPVVAPVAPAAPRQVVSDYLADAYLSSHLSPIKPRKMIADKKAAAEAADGKLTARGTIHCIDKPRQP
ncbi:unnamed protein product [Symbiodinium sp. CCMP2592]|nr:unnamed protein product [Symbiodinium sp. CCMP2592]